LACVATPVGTVDLRASAERGAGAVVDQNSLRCMEVELLGILLELIEDRVQ
jgi:hypothetical protein